MHIFRSFSVGHAYSLFLSANSYSIGEPQPLHVELKAGKDATFNHGTASSRLVKIGMSRVVLRRLDDDHIFETLIA